MNDGPGGEDLLIRRALESGLVTSEQVRAAMAESGDGESVAQVLLRRRIVAAEDWAKIEGDAAQAAVPQRRPRLHRFRGVLLPLWLAGLVLTVGSTSLLLPFWFDRSSPSVAPKARNDASFVGGAVPRTVRAAQRFRIVVTMRNTGTTPWSRERGYYLGSEGPRDNQVWGTNRGIMPVGLEVAPGASCDFSADLVAPAAPGVYAMQWRVLQDAVEWFGEATGEARVEVTE